MAVIFALLVLLAVCNPGIQGSSLRDDEEDPNDPYSGAKRERQGDLTKLGSFSTKPGGSYVDRMPPGVTPHIWLLSNKTSAYATLFNDPMWPKQWYMQDYRTEDSPVYDHNVVPVYKMNINGSGVVVAVLDTGVKPDHPDLVDNYIEALSYDYVNKKRGSRPKRVTFNYGKAQLDTHGTRAAGVIAMAANNGVCGVGVAYGAKIAGVVAIAQFADNIAMDPVLGRALVHKLSQVDIYSCSFGSHRFGKFVHSAEKMTTKAISVGVTKGRGYKGAIYVFSAGNERTSVDYRGAIPLDNCATGKHTNNPHIIVIAGASQKGRTTHYSEACANVFATAYSSGYVNEERVVATDANRDCTAGFSGTSAAAAVASGIIALVLSANKELTYRDVMHLIAAGSEVAPLAENSPTWYDNAAGFTVSNDFGFGLLNAENMVLMAQKWTRVPPKKVCVINVNVNRKVYFEMESSQLFTVDTDACQSSGKDGVFFLEHIELATTLNALTKIERGDFSIYLTSPKGTKSLLMSPRAKDRDSDDGFDPLSVTSVHNWGEDPKGKWKIHVYLHDYEKTWSMPKEKPKAGSFEGRTAQISSMEREGSLWEKFDPSGLSGKTLFSRVFGKPKSSKPKSIKPKSIKPKSSNPSPDELLVQNEQAKDGGMSGAVRGFTLTLHGTHDKPAHYNTVAPYREYATFTSYDATIKNI